MVLQNYSVTPFVILIFLCFSCCVESVRTRNILFFDYRLSITFMEIINDA